MLKEQRQGVSFSGLFPEEMQDSLADLQKGARNFLIKVTRDIPLSEDIISMTFVKALDPQRSWQDRDHFRAWFIVSAKNHFKDILRKTQTKPAALSLDDPDQTVVGETIDLNQNTDPSTILTREESFIKLHQAVNGLPDEQRIAVEGRFFWDLSAEEIGQLIGKGAGNVRVIQRRGLIALKKLLDDNFVF
jgi:RNA polymerase sigma factor (sigma-70 family)